MSETGGNVELRLRAAVESSPSGVHRTGYLENMDAGTLESAGVVGVLKKPATVAEMAQAVSTALRQA